MNENLPACTSMQHNKADSADVVEICPTVAELEKDVCTNIQCPVTGCGKVLAQSSALRLHLVAVHKIVEV